MDGSDKIRNRYVWLKRVISLVVMVLLPSTVVLATSPTQLGPMTFSRFPDHPSPMPVGWPPGGIVFRTVAKPQQELRLESISYTPTREDGKRLTVQFFLPEGLISFNFVGLFDWQMVPIAHLAEDDSATLVTLFGSLDDPDETERAIQQGHLIANVHGVLQNTLLGLRLIQADMLLLSKQRGSGQKSGSRIKDIVCDLPETNGRYLLGGGENFRSPEDNKQAYNAIDRNRSELFDRIGWGRSYVILDDPMGISISASVKGLSLTGNPSWRYWRYHADSEEFLDSLSKKLPSQVGQRLQQEQPVAENRISRTIELYTELWEEALDSAEGTEVQWLPEEQSRSLSATINQKQGANPTVYNALVNTMRYLSFFRYVRQQDPDQYERFVNSLPSIGMYKSVSTPAIIPIGK